MSMLSTSQVLHAPTKHYIAESKRFRTMKQTQSQGQGPQQLPNYTTQTEQHFMKVYQYSYLLYKGRRGPLLVIDEIVYLAMCLRHFSRLREGNLVLIKH